MRRLPSLNAIKAFRKVAELGGISKAATQLHVSQSAVSRFISLLESELGVELFNRKKDFALTDAGRTFYEHVTRSFEILEEGVLRLGKAHSKLRIKTNPTFALRWLLHQKDIPNEVSIEPRWKSISLEDDDFDVGIRWGQGNWPKKNAICLYDEMLMPVCTHEYLQNNGPYESASTLSRAALVHADPTHHDWQAWAQRWSGGVFPVDQGMTFDTLDNALQGAVANHGIAMADYFLVQRELLDGRLVAAVSELHPSGESYFLVYRNKLAGDERLKVFAQWIKLALAAAMKSMPPVSNEIRPSSLGLALPSDVRVASQIKPKPQSQPSSVS